MFLPVLLISLFVPPTAELGTPTTIDFVRCDTSQVVVGYTSADAVVYDLETGKPILTLDGRTLSGESEVKLTGVNCYLGRELFKPAALTLSQTY